MVLRTDNDRGQASPQLMWHEIATAEQNPPVFDKLFELSWGVFAAYTPSDELRSQQIESSDIWKQHIGLPGASIFYATNTASTKPDEPLGFLFVVPRTQPLIGVELLHIKIAAVDEQSRGFGVFPFLLDRVKQLAARCGYREITVCTFPGRFQKMYRMLSSNGWKVVGWPVQNEKILMKLTV